MRKHYKLTKESKVLRDGAAKVFRIEALIDGPWGPKGTKGGFVESEKNLEQGSKAWVSGEAWVYGNARASGEDMIYGNARVSGEEPQTSGSGSGPLTRAIEALEKLSGMEEAISVLVKAKEEKSNTL